MLKGKSSKIKFSSLTHAARQPIFHKMDRPECNILNTEITEKEMPEIATTIITVPEKLGSRVESTSQEWHTRNRYIFKIP